MSQIILFALVALTALPTAFGLHPVDVNVLHNFDSGVWAENLAVRANGQILVTRFDTPEVLQLDPTGSKAPTVVASWGPATYMGCLGISEISADVYYVVVSGFLDDNFVLTSGVNSIWEIDMSTFAVSRETGEVVSNATVSKLVDVTTSGFLNGLTALSTSAVLVADSYKGCVYRVDTRTGKYEVVVNDTKMKFDSISEPAVNIGVNGIKIRNGYLYWTNTAVGTLNRIRVSNKGIPSGRSEVVVNNVATADDFTFDSNGVAFITQNFMDELSILHSKWEAAEVIAGSNISTILAGVTAGIFGRLPGDESILYLTTSGAAGSPINGSVTVPATLSWIDTSKIRA
ncbi:hypothetical protein N7533_010508 [Penicillium manginii]|uniref:uncharacterized protein n=1 Tax=Penicillium manginii TaxID=203109 RepID=UPI0025495C02|nr:uncharacterized protein N7533_010508 [Penicillium manginii]KAJ5743406.1 hypothetical protein N7533_010508 [Penicillium manginii]